MTENPSPPNLYSFATTELSQDATVAYILAWADPKYGNASAAHSGMHALGRALLGALVTSHPDRKDWAPEKVTSVKVATQEKRVDIRADITTEDEKVFLIVEDKIHSGEHGDQIRRYVEKAQSRYEESEIVPVYLKTGNESPNRTISIRCGRFFRGDLLAVLDDHPETGNRIVDEFRDHWRRFDTYTKSFRRTPPSEWDWPRFEGYYLELEKKLAERGVHAWWHTDTIRGSTTYLHLFCKAVPRKDGNEVRIQIRSGHRDLNQLTVQATRPKGRVDSATLRRLFEEHQAAESSLAGGRIHRSGQRFRGGGFPQFMKITFDEDRESYVALDADGKVDLDETANRIVRVREFLETVSGCADDSG